MDKRISCMFDTVAFNCALDIGDSALKAAYARGELRLYATHIQRDELCNTKEPDRRGKLIEIFEFLVPRDTDPEHAGEIPTESAVIGVSRFGKAKFSDGVLYQRILTAMDECKKENNNKRDALIAETAIRNNLILVTDDKVLAKVTRQFGGEAISFDELLRCRNLSSATMPGE